MNNILFYHLASYIYLICLVLYLIRYFFQNEKVGKAATICTCFGFGINFYAFILRWIESYRLGIGHLPIRGPYECLTFSAASIILLYLWAERMIKTRALGAFVLPVVAVIMIYANLNSKIDNRIYPMPQVLQDIYINYHLFSCFIGYSAFCISFVASLIYLLGGSGSWESKNRILMPKTLDSISYKMIAIGFILFSIMIITGMFRTRIVWGTYWQWDPVQNWSLLSWIIYAIILHGRYTYKWTGTRTALLSIIGFLFAIVTFLIGAGFIPASGHFPITE